MRIRNVGIVSLVCMYISIFWNLYFDHIILLIWACDSQIFLFFKTDFIDLDQDFKVRQLFMPWRFQCSLEL